MRRTATAACAKLYEVFSCQAISYNPQKVLLSILRLYKNSFISVLVYMELS